MSLLLTDIRDIALQRLPAVARAAPLTLIARARAVFAIEECLEVLLERVRREKAFEKARRGAATPQDDAATPQDDAASLRQTDRQAETLTRRVEAALPLQVEGSQAERS